MDVTNDNPYLPDWVLHATGPLWARMRDESPASTTGRRWHLIQQGRGQAGEWHGFRLACGRVLEGTNESLDVQPDEPPADDDICDECYRAPRIVPQGMGDSSAGT
jgi:hypothetical protein